jgi:uncharacterized protein (DUF1778 family)
VFVQRPKRRTDTVRFRTAPGERRLLELAATLSNLTLSELIRDAVLPHAQRIVQANSPAPDRAQ